MENTVKMPTKEQRIEIYRRVRDYLKGNGIAGFCKGFRQVSLEKDMRRMMCSDAGAYIKPNFFFDANTNRRLAANYPEIAKRKPKTWYKHGSTYWFDPCGNKKNNAPRIRILTEAIKELGGE
jgi:hypothetical protein